MRVSSFVCGVYSAGRVFTEGSREWPQLVVSQPDFVYSGAVVYDSCLARAALWCSSWLMSLKVVCPEYLNIPRHWEGILKGLADGPSLVVTQADFIYSDCRGI